MHASVGGKVAQLGQRLIDGAAKSIAEDFFRPLDEEMQKQHPEAYAAQATAPASSAPRAATSGERSIRAWACVVGAVVAAAAASWLLR